MVELIWTRRYSFQSVHRLDSGPQRERTHGHHYFVEVTFSGVEIDTVDQAVEQNVLSRLHARELSELAPSTGENIVNWIHSRLSSLGPHLKAVALQETRKNRFVSSASEARYV